MSKQYIVTIPTSQLLAFTMPKGFETAVTFHMWGAGGGRGGDAGGYGSYGGKGGGGSYVSGTLNVNQGDLVEISIGAHGTDASSTTPGIGGSGHMGNRFAGGNGGTYTTIWYGDGDGDGDDTLSYGGAGGGGGAASAFLLNGYTVAVAAGGAGGEGGSPTGANGADGLGGDHYPSVPSGLYYRVSHPAWSSLLNTYGIWPGSATTVVNFPSTGTYTFKFSVDNYGSISLDGTPIISRSGEFNYGSIYTASVTVSAGNHTIGIAGYNIGGPAGVAAQIINPDSSELWNTTALLMIAGLNSTSVGGDGGTALGGGGAGYLGGIGGEGGLSYASTVIPGNGSVSGGRSTVYAPVAPVGNAGYDGYAVLVFTRKFNAKIKESTWKQLETAFVKVGGIWKNINQVWTKAAGTWMPILSNNTINTKSTIFYDNLVAHTFIVPAGVTVINATLVGAGGGGGGTDSHGGYQGFSGSVLTGAISVTPGDTISIAVGGEGGAGYSGTSTGAGAAGDNALGYTGGRGGVAGGRGWSGGGGGGGGASVVQVNGTDVAIAAGGGGGGGGGNYSNGQGQSTPTQTGSHVGGQGVDHSGDGGGSGGGGGGDLGGAGGPTVGGDNGGYSGSNGTNLVPASWIVSSANNAGAAGVAGGRGSVTITF